MHKLSLKSAMWAAVLPSLMIACQPAENFQSTTPSDVVHYGTKNSSARTGGTQKYIVTFKSDQSLNRYLPEDNSDYETRNQRIRTLISRLIGIDIATKTEYVYSSSIKGFAAELSDYDLQVLQKFSFIESVTPDQEIMVSIPTGAATAIGAQEIPWGITRVGGPRTFTGSQKVFVLDTGIDLDHPDLNVNVALSRNFVNSRRTPDDDNGHGTHVAGTIAAKNNSIGVVGVAPGAQVVAVKVLASTGSGSYAGIISGVDYVAATGSAGDVANMSLGGPGNTPLDNAVIAAANKGIKFALAAGNEAQNTNNVSPGRVNHPNVVTVSAHDINNRFASFSNYANPPIDWCAPGVNIRSTWRSGGYFTISGTSMATPHVAGILLFGTPSSRGPVSNDPDGTADIMAALPGVAL
ncbi:S8 family peptidase [Tellurirhabdus bombi]|uniref:S8 family peptidase n=1 Tax=Tellurirhabdus bombi TaxID=2907205 RepID=UPI001F2F3537|nr:S8 family peptidase [Tellurirhabdus bombi]